MLLFSVIVGMMFRFTGYEEEIINLFLNGSLVLYLLWQIERHRISLNAVQMKGVMTAGRWMKYISFTMVIKFLGITGMFLFSTFILLLFSAIQELLIIFMSVSEEELAVRV